MFKQILSTDARYSTLAYLGLIFLIVFIYRGTIAWIINYWFTIDGSYGIMILGMCIYMTWRKRDDFKDLSVRSGYLLGTGLLALGCLILIIGKISATYVLEGMSLIVTMLGIIMLLLGPDFLRALWIPIGFLIFAFPLLDELLGNYSIHLQNTAAWIASLVISITGMPVVNYNQYLYLPHVTLEVARLCNGIHHIISLLAFGIFAADIRQLKWHQSIILICCAFVIGILANGLRIAMIGIFSAYFKNMPLHGPYDIFFVSFIFIFGVMGLLLISSGMEKISKNRDKNKISKQNNHSGVDYKRISMSILEKGQKPIIVAISILLLTVLFLHLNKTEPQYLTNSLDTIPLEIGKWNGETTVIGNDDFLGAIAADDAIKRIYSNEYGERMTLYVGYFTQQNSNKKLISHNVDWLHHETEIIAVESGSDIFNVKKTNMNEKEKRSDVYFWYDINGRHLVGKYEGKLATVVDGMIHKRTNGGLVVVIVESVSDSKENSKSRVLEFIQEIIPVTHSLMTPA